MIYTSGSTGTPKGVVVTHAGAGEPAGGRGGASAPGPGSRVAQATSTGFDASVLEIFVALLSGAALQRGRARDRALPRSGWEALLRER